LDDFAAFRKNTNFCFVSFITLAFLGQFLYFLYQWKQELIFYREINKIYNIILTASPHYLIKTAHFETTVADRFLQCVRSNRLFATFTQSCLSLTFIFLIFWKNNFVRNFMSVFWQKIFHIFIGFDHDFIFNVHL